MRNGKNSNGCRRSGLAANRLRPGLRRCRNGAGRNGDGPVVITGGAGFVGTNLAHRLLSQKRRVVLFDNLSRPGVEQNLAWLRSVHGSRVQHEHADVRDPQALRKVVKHAAHVFHFAAQVAVTTSLTEPIEDFEINARGTLNLLEALRSLAEPPPLVFTSTNKVYGDLADVKLRLNHGRYEPEDEEVRQHGFSELRPLRFHSPYGCSKGAACQYVQDYARTFGLPTAVFRMSCIYGSHQFGNEDQGWVAHFLIRARERSPITIYGDGRQVRDVLFVEDLVDAFLLAQEHMDRVAGQAFNIGGGPSNSTSLLELMEMIRELQGHQPEVRFEDWRLADQLYYVSDTRKFSAATGWKPRTDFGTGLKQLYHWLQEFHGVVPARRAGLRVVAPRHPNQPGSASSRAALEEPQVRRVKLPSLKGTRRANGAAGNGTERKFAKAL